MRKQLQYNPWQVTPHGVEIFIHLQPRASHDRVIGRYGDTLKIALTAPPVENAANAALLRFLASQLDVSPSAVILLRGEKSRDKHVLIRALCTRPVIERLTELLRRVDKKKRDD